jgi:prolyl-tRNA editing enzyme YbaK/EbsC (Cys-tRNA(Pro) deacylase)
VTDKQLANSFDSSSLAEFLKKHKIEFKIKEFKEDTKTVVRASNFVPEKMIIKSLVLMDSSGSPFIAILQANKKASFKKLKKLLNVKDVRLATPEEVKRYSGYEIGAVPPIYHKDIDRVIVDIEVTKLHKAWGGCNK